MSTRTPARLALVLGLVLLAELGTFWWTRAAPAADPAVALALYEGNCYLRDDPLQFYDPLVLGADGLSAAVVQTLEDPERMSREARGRLVLWLAMRGDPAGLPALERLARDERDLSVLRADALQALGVLDPERGRALRAELLADPACTGLVRRAIERLDAEEAAAGIWTPSRGWWAALLSLKAPVVD